MARFKFAPESTGGPMVADLVDKDLALFPIEVGQFETKIGDRPGIKVHVYDLTGEDPEDLGRALMFQEVLLDELSKSLGEWTVGRIVKPGKAYLLRPPEDIELVTELMALVPDEPPARASHNITDDESDDDDLVAGA